MHFYSTSLQFYSFSLQFCLGTHSLIQFGLDICQMIDLRISTVSFVMQSSVYTNAMRQRGKHLFNLFHFQVTGR